MTKLTDTQLLILSSAAQRDDLAVELPPTIPEATGRRAIGQLRKRGYLEEVAATGDVPVWRREEDSAFALIITPAGLDAIGIAPEERRPNRAPRALKSTSRTRTAAGRAKQQPAPSKNALGRSSAPRPGSKLEGVLGLLREPAGASIAQMIEATGWLPHTTRAALTGLRKRGYSIERITGPEGKSSYRLASASAGGGSECLSDGSKQA